MQAVAAWAEAALDASGCGRRGGSLGSGCEAACAGADGLGCRGAAFCCDWTGAADRLPGNGTGWELWAGREDPWYCCAVAAQDAMVASAVASKVTRRCLAHMVKPDAFLRHGKGGGALLPIMRASSREDGERQ
jgi:hypothetical protein